MSQNGRKGKYPRTVSVAMTEEMHANLLRVAKARQNVPALIRSYIRHGLDQQAEIAGSRRYFTGRFKDAVKLQRLEMRWFMTVLLVLLSQGLSYLILGIYPDLDDDSRKQFSGPALFKAAVAQAESQGHRIQQQLDDLFADKTLDEEFDV